MSPAYAEVEFIKSKIKKRHQNDIITPQTNRNFNQNNKEKNFIDLDQIYVVQPNKILTSRVIFKQNQNKELRS